MWLLGTWYALAASVICLWLWYRGLPYVETWLAGLATAAIPVVALATSALYLGETIDPHQVRRRRAGHRGHRTRRTLAAAGGTAAAMTLPRA